MPPNDDNTLEYKGHHIELTRAQSKDLRGLATHIRELAEKARLAEQGLPALGRAPWRSWLFDIQACIDYMWEQIDPEVRGPRSLSREVAAKDKEIAELTAQLERSRLALGLWGEIQAFEHKARDTELENAKAYITRLEGIQAELTEVDKAREAELREAQLQIVALEQEVEGLKVSWAQDKRRLDNAYRDMEIRASQILTFVQDLRARSGRSGPGLVVVSEPLDARIAEALGYNVEYIRTRSLEQVRATLKVNAETHVSRAYIDLIAEIDELNSRNVPGPWWAAR
jgi:DNA repair exonuclease SbcCD ATPase subunit